jgi:3-dehydroquinate synthase
MFAAIKAEYPNNKYPIYISDNLTSQISLFLKGHPKSNIIIIIDQVFKDKKLHIDQNFTSLLNDYNTYFIDGGIENKSLSKVNELCNLIFNLKIPRDGFIVSIGGGVIGDLCGLVASLYMRGINLIHVPTTMTAAVDSSIGGKTGVNFNKTINLIGSYYHPKAIFIDMRFFLSLEKRDLNSGIAESIKSAFIADIEFYNFLDRNSENILGLSFDHIYDLIYKSIQIKLYHTVSDEKEQSKRLFLNYGHTFGQSFESFYGIDESLLRHGEAVSIGMVCAAKLAEIIYENKMILDQHKSLLLKYKLPIEISKIKSKKIPTIDTLTNGIENDKKRITEGNKFIICKELANAEIIIINDKSIIEECFQTVI